MPPEIRFACPTCQSKFAVPEDMGGKKIRCSKCGQKLAVPVPKPHHEEFTLPQADLPSMEMPDIPREEGSSRGSGKSRKAFLIIAGGLMVSATAVAGVLWLWSWYTFPSEVKEGVHWSNRELVDYLQGQGMKFDAKGEVISHPDIESIVLLTKSQFLPPMKVGNVMSAFTGHSWGDNGKVLEDSGVVFVFKFHSADKSREVVKKARDEALVSGDILSSWGRFVFVGDAKLLSEIRAALQGKRVAAPPTSESGAPTEKGERRPIETRDTGKETKPVTPDTRVSPTEKSPKSTAKEEPKITVLDPASPERTLENYAKIAEPIVRLKRENEIAYNRELKRLESIMGNCTGASINWPVIVESVTGRGISIKGFFGTTREYYQLQIKANANSIGLLASGFTEDFAASLKPKNTILLNGKIKSVNFRNNPITIVFELEDGYKVTAP